MKTQRLTLARVLLPLVCLAWLLSLETQSISAHSEQAFSGSAILFSDDFNDGNAKGWTTSGVGSWYVENGEYVEDMGSGCDVWGVSNTGNPNWTDYAFQVDVEGNAGVDKRIYARYLDDNNYYILNIRSDPGNDVLLAKEQNGVGTLLADVPFALANGIGYHVKMVLQGSEIRVYINDALLVDQSDNGTSLTHGKIALGGYTGASCSDKVRFDNVVVSTPKDRSFFYDGFDGSAIDSTKWNTDIATSGVRWCPDDPVDRFRPGKWQDMASMTCQGVLQSSPYGNINVNNGNANFSSGTSRAFSYIYAGPPSRPSPFPVEGDFVLEIRMKYNSMLGFGDGFQVFNWGDSDPIGNNSPIGQTHVFGVWGDLTSGLTTAMVDTSVQVLDPLAFHDYRVEYKGGKYSLFIDDSLQLGPTTSSLRPTTLWLGNPLFTYWGASAWSDFDIDFVSVTSPTYSISGQVTFAGGTTPVSGVTISDGIGDTKVTDANGRYQFSNLPEGDYALTPSKSGLSFIPYESDVALKSDMSDLNFAGFYKQDQGPWSQCDKNGLFLSSENNGCVYMGEGHSWTFKGSGCGVTSLADVLAYWGQTGNGALVDPGYLNHLLATKEVGLLNPDSGLMDWPGLNAVLVKLNTGLIADYKLAGGAGPDKLDARIADIEKALNPDVGPKQYPIISVLSPAGRHYVVIVGEQGKDADGHPDFVINDPLASGFGGSGDQSGLPLSRTVYGTIKSIWDAGYLQTIIIKQGASAANSWFNIQVEPANIAKPGGSASKSQLALSEQPATQLLITDPSGKQSGFDPTTGTYLQNIPGAVYSVEGGIGDPTGQGPSTPLVPMFSAEGPSAGTYKIEVIGTSAISYSLDVVTTIGTNDPVVQTVAGTASPGVIQNYVTTYNGTSNPPPIQMVLEDSHTSDQFNGWRGVSDSSASGGTYRVSKVKNDMATFKFKGTNITWFTHKGPDQGKAAMLIDGVVKKTLDLYAPTATANFSQTIKGLTNLTHTLTIQVLGTKNAKSSGYDVSVDAFKVGKTTTQDDSSAVAYNTWAGTLNANASGGSYRWSKTKNTSASLAFTGTSINWITATGKNYGKAQVWIDKVLTDTVDLYSLTPQWQVVKSYTGLSNGQHTIQIKVLGTKNAKSTGYRVVVDAFSGPITTVGTNVSVSDVPEGESDDNTN